MYVSQSVGFEVHCTFARWAEEAEFKKEMSTLVQQFDGPS